MLILQLGEAVDVHGSETVIDCLLKLSMTLCCVVVSDEVVKHYSYHFHQG